MKIVRIILILAVFIGLGAYCWITRNDAYQRGYRAATGFNSPEEYEAHVNNVISHHIDSIIAKKLK